MASPIASSRSFIILAAISSRKFAGQRKLQTDRTRRPALKRPKTCKPPGQLTPAGEHALAVGSKAANSCHRLNRHNRSPTHANPPRA
jgi:hypothetical protein